MIRQVSNHANNSEGVAIHSPVIIITSPISHTIHLINNPCIMQNNCTTTHRVRHYTLNIDNTPVKKHTVKGKWTTGILIMTVNGNRITNKSSLN